MSRSSSDQSEIIKEMGPNSRIRIVLPLVIGIAFFECYAQYTLKHDRENGGKNKWRCLVAAGIAYAIVCYLLYKSYQYEGMGHVNILWSCVSILLAYAVGVSFFNEHINKYGYVAIFFACMAIYFSHRNDEAPRDK